MIMKIWSNYMAYFLSFFSIICLYLRLLQNAIFSLETATTPRHDVLVTDLFNYYIEFVLTQEFIHNWKFKKKNLNKSRSNSRAQIKIAE